MTLQCVEDQQEAMDVLDQTLAVARLDILETNVNYKFVMELLPMLQLFVQDMVHVTLQILAHVQLDMVDQTVSMQSVLEYSVATLPFVLLAVLVRLLELQ